MRNKILAALAAGGLLIGAGVVTSIVSAPATAEAQEDTTTEEREGPAPRILGFLDEVLDQVVSDGTITQEQADAVSQAAAAKAEEVKAERQAHRELVKGFLEDDVITADEAAQLGDDAWLNSEVFDEAWEDGQLTREEIRKERPRVQNFRRAAHFGALLDDGGIDQAEYDSLGEDHPLKQIDLGDALADGVITIEELRQLHEQNK